MDKRELDTWTDSTVGSLTATLTKVHKSRTIIYQEHIKVKINEIVQNKILLFCTFIQVIKVKSNLTQISQYNQGTLTLYPTTTYICEMKAQSLHQNLI